MNALFDINRQMIGQPQLWGVYDVASLGPEFKDSPLEVCRRRSFLWYHFNLFETVWADYHTHHLGTLTSVDRRYWDSWDRYVRSFLAGSGEAREIVQNRQAMSLLNEDFVDYLRRTVSSLERDRVKAWMST